LLFGPALFQDLFAVCRIVRLGHPHYYGRLGATMAAARTTGGASGLAVRVAIADAGRARLDAAGGRKMAVRPERPPRGCELSWR
jgi:hypothetical protein